MWDLILSGSHVPQMVLLAEYCKVRFQSRQQWFRHPNLINSRPYLTSSFPSSPVPLHGSNPHAVGSCHRPNRKSRHGLFNLQSPQLSEQGQACAIQAKHCAASTRVNSVLFTREEIRDAFPTSKRVRRHRKISIKHQQQEIMKATRLLHPIHGPILLESSTKS